MEKLLVVDGNSIINRAFYGVRLLTNEQGVYTNAIYGFLNILMKYLSQDAPDYIAVAFDLPAPTFRHKQYAEYKAGRKGMPEELAMQLPLLKEALAAMNIPQLSLEGYEADDIIGTVSRMCEESGVECLVVTGDRDALQLASDTTKIYLTSTRGGETQLNIMDYAAVQEKYGVTPQEMIEVKGLMGDTSDHIPGVAGIGEKTALKLIGEYHSLEAVYEHIGDMKGAVKTKLENGKDSAFLSRTLGLIERRVPLQETLEGLRRKDYNEPALFELLNRLGLKSLVKKLGLEDQKVPVREYHPVVVTQREEAEKIVPTLGESSFYLLCDDAVLAGVSVYDGENSYYFHFNSGLLCDLELEDLKDYFENGAQKCTHGSKEAYVLLKKAGINLRGVVFDSEIAAYIIDPSRSSYDIGSLSDFESREMLFGKGRSKISMMESDETMLAQYGAKCAGAVLDLREKYVPLMQQRAQDTLFEEVEMPLTRVLADMELEGFHVDVESLKAFSSMLEENIERAERTIYDMAGETFNILSPKQLGTVLFETLKLPVVKKTKTGYSTNAEVLDKLEEEHPIIGHVKEYRTLTKLKSTYCDGLLNVLERDGKIHSKFNQTVTVTGRISSTEPNLQNIPVRTELGREMRRMFTVSDEDYILLDADYSQIELRVLAHISGDERLIQAFIDEEDIHTITASQVFGVSPELVSSEMRRSAKAVNFGIVYGISDFALAQDLHITKKQAKAYMDGYLEKYSGVRKYMDDIVEEAEQNGYVSTILGRRRYIPELKSGKFQERSFGKRVALNTPIQGSAADIIKIAMVKVHAALQEKKLKSRLILQVHDELIVETHKSEVEQVKQMLSECMQNAVSLAVPLVAEVKTGRSWYEAK